MGRACSNHCDNQSPAQAPGRRIRAIPKALTTEFTGGRPERMRKQLMIQRVSDVNKKPCLVLWNTELEFLNKCQIPVFWNPGIWGEGEFVDVLYNILKLAWDLQGSLTVGFVVNPANWYFTDPGYILTNITFTQFQLFKFVDNNSVNSVSGEKWRSWA